MAVPRSSSLTRSGLTKEDNDVAPSSGRRWIEPRAQLPIRLEAMSLRSVRGDRPSLAVGEGREAGVEVFLHLSQEPLLLWGPVLKSCLGDGLISMISSPLHELPSSWQCGRHVVAELLLPGMELRLIREEDEWLADTFSVDSRAGLLAQLFQRLVHPLISLG